MNSVYKRYFFITLLVLIFSCSIAVNKNIKFFGEIDRVNTYAAENGDVNAFDFRLLNIYTADNSEGETGYYPDFDYTRYNITDSDGIWTVAVAILLILFYFYERSTLTADFCAVLPVKNRNKFIVKAGFIVFVAVVLTIIELWAVNAFNQRVPACNETYRLLGITDETVDMIQMFPLNEVTIFFQKLAFGAVLILLSELTGKVYLPVCIWILGMMGILGSIFGIYEYFYIYYDINIFSFMNDIDRYILRHEYYREYIIAAVMIFVTLACGLWAYFLSGRGDMSRKGRVFRFGWAQWIALGCITVCAVLCTFEIIYLTELNYMFSAGMSLVAMIIAGIIAFFMARRIIFWLGR